MSRTTIGTRIREWRQKMNMTQEDFADKIGKSRYYVSQVERGKQSPTMDMIEAIAAAAGVTLEEFFKGI